MNIRTFRLAAGLALVVASTSMANIIGSSYTFGSSSTGNTQISATPGNYTDPANPGFCVGPPLECDQGAGVSGSFSFADSTPTTSTITFLFFGSTDGAGPGSFSLSLSNFTGDPITSITYGGGNLQEGDFSSVTWNGTTATFTGSADFDYSALGGSTVVFNVTTVPEPASILMLGAGVGMLVIRKKRHHA